MATSPKTITALAWYPHIPATENQILDMASSRQIALRIRLRNHYWLTECKPISPVTVALVRRKMVMIDSRDTLTGEEVAEVLSDHYGFEAQPDGSLTIPDLDKAHGDVLASVAVNKARASAGGRGKAAKAALMSGAPNPAVSGFSAAEPHDF